MTKQEIYTKVRTHLLTQNERSQDGPYKCLYKATDGNKCAIGCLIPDDKYSEAIEGMGVFELVRDGQMSFLLPEGSGIKQGSDFLLKLQEIHDDHNPRDWEGVLDAFAKEEGLV